MNTPTLVRAAQRHTTQHRSGSLLPVLLHGSRAYLDVDLVADEVSRRRYVGLHALVDRAAIALLFELPADLPVPIEHLDQAEVKQLRRLPPGCVSITAHVVVRHVVPPVRVNAAVVTARTWRAGLHKATRFSPFCPKTLLLPRAPADGADADLMIANAHRYGVGVATPDDASSGVAGRQTAALRWLMEPAPFVPACRTAASWLFEEQAFAQLTHHLDMPAS
jgi:hypothetical protein